MAGIAQYAPMIASGGRGLTDDPLSTGAEEAMAKGTGGLTLGLMATYPVAVNNPGRFGNTYNDLADTAIKATSALNTFTSYKDGLGLLNPYGGEGYNQAIATTSPKNLLNTTFDILSYMNPVTASLNIANKLTQDDQDAPFGNLPGMKQVAQGLNVAGDFLDDTFIGEGLETVTDFVYDNTIGPLMATEPGKFFYDLASLPMNAVKGTYRTVKELGELVDRTVFGGYLPGLAKDDDPQSQQWNNPFKPLTENYAQVKDKVIDALTTSDEEAFTEQINEWAESQFPGFENVTPEDIPGLFDMWNEGLKNATPTDMSFYQDNPSYIPEGDYYNPTDNTLNTLPGGGRFVSDPQDHSETGLGYTYIPDGYTYDPDIGIVKSHDSNSEDFIPKDTNDYQAISDADKKVMDGAIALTEENQKVMDQINETARQNISDSARTNASIGNSIFYQRDIQRQLDTAIRNNYYNNYNHVDRYNRDYGTGRTSMNA